LEQVVSKVEVPKFAPKNKKIETDESIKKGDKKTGSFPVYHL
jgi:hypothetical protein